MAHGHVSREKLRLNNSSIVLKRDWNHGVAEENRGPVGARRQRVGRTRTAAQSSAVVPGVAASNKNGLVFIRISGPVAQLLGRVLSPAHQGPVVKRSAREILARSNGNGRAAGTKIDRRRWRSWLNRADAAAQSQLPVVVEPPALYGAVVEDGAGVPASRRNGHGRSA